MGMSTHVVGFKPPDEKRKAMKEARDACVAADIEIPRVAAIEQYEEGKPRYRDITSWFGQRSEWRETRRKPKPCELTGGTET